MANYRVIRWAGLWWCLCVCFLWSVTADAARRVPVEMRSARDGASGTPSKSAGSLIVSNPVLHGQYIPYDGHGTGRKMHIPVSGRNFYSLYGTTYSAKNLLRANVPQLAIGAAIAGLAAGLDWVFDNSDAQWKAPSTSHITDPGLFVWRSNNNNSIGGPTPDAACEAYLATQPTYGVYAGFVPWNGDTLRCQYQADSGRIYTTIISPYAPCPDGSSYNHETYRCDAVGVMVPLDDTHLDQLDGVIANSSPEFIQDILKDACNGSNAPDRCFEDLLERTELTGPASVTSPATITTTTVTGPDGISTQQQTQTVTRIDITYGDNYYDYTTTRTSTTTNADGSTSVTTDTDSDPDAEPEESPLEVAKPCAEDCEGPAYEDLYTPTDDTKESLADSYMSRVQAIPLFAAVGGFFDVSVSASCPVWQTDLAMDILGESFSYQLVFDYHCQPWFVDLRPFCLVVFMIFGAGVAFRIAIL